MMHGIPMLKLPTLELPRVNLAQFELGQIGAWTQPYDPDANFWFMLPNKDLAPGKSFVAAAAYDWNPKMWLNTIPTIIPGS